METNLEQCPLCGSELSQTKFREIRAKLRDQEQRKATELAEAKLAITRSVEVELKKGFELQRQAAEKKVKEEADQRVKKALAEREQVAKQLLEAQQREEGIREQARLGIEKQKQAAEKKAKADAEQQIKKVAAERDLAAKKLKEAQDREAQVRKQTEQQAEKNTQKQLLEQRQALEKDKNLALLKQQSENHRDRDSLQKKVKMLEHQLQNKTANELGDGGEIDVFEALRDAFQGDKITRIRKGQPGADILHEVLYKGEVCGRIVVDSKNRQAWQNTFVSKLRQDQVEAEAEQAILATTVFPAGKKEMCIESGVIVISRARVVHIVHVLRQAMVMMHVKGLSMNERTGKMSQLYKLITSESYAAKFTEANRLTQDILELEVKEQAEHTRVWKNRGALVKRTQNILREVETDVAAVIESNGDAKEALPVFDGKRSTLQSAPS
ncbi:MAG: DUF2130 domain-containing protein [Candidatus Acidiferrales bacterium]